MASTSAWRNPRRKERSRRRTRHHQPPRDPSLHCLCLQRASQQETSIAGSPRSAAAARKRGNNCEFIERSVSGHRTRMLFKGMSLVSALSQKFSPPDEERNKATARMDEREGVPLGNERVESVVSDGPLEAPTVRTTPTTPSFWRSIGSLSSLHMQHHRVCSVSAAPTANCWLRNPQREPPKQS